MIFRSHFPSLEALGLPDLSASKAPKTKRAPKHSARRTPPPTSNNSAPTSVSLPPTSPHLSTTTALTSDGLPPRVYTEEEANIDRVREAIETFLEAVAQLRGLNTVPLVGDWLVTFEALFPGEDSQKLFVLAPGTVGRENAFQLAAGAAGTIAAGGRA